MSEAAPEIAEPEGREVCIWREPHYRERDQRDPENGCGWRTLHTFEPNTETPEPEAPGQECTAVLVPSEAAHTLMRLQRLSPETATEADHAAVVAASAQILECEVTGEHEVHRNGDTEWRDDEDGIPDPPEGYRHTYDLPDYEAVACTRCGSVVVDTAQHDELHLTLILLLGQAGAAKLGPKPVTAADAHAGQETVPLNAERHIAPPEAEDKPGPRLPRLGPAKDKA